MLGGLNAQKYTELMIRTGLACRLALWALSIAGSSFNVLLLGIGLAGFIYFYATGWMNL